MATFPKVYKDQRLRADAADSYKRLATSFPSDIPALTVRSGYRSDAEQEAIFYRNMTTDSSKADGTGRTRTYKGVRYFVRKGYALAAPPGYSNHRSGLAADFGPSLTSFTSAQYKALAKTAPYFGWDNAEGRGINEPWHWLYTPKSDTSAARKGWFHVKTSKTNSYSVKTSRRTHTRKRNFNVYVSHGILLNGSEWLVTNHGNRYRATHLAKGRSKPKPVYRTVYVTAKNGLRGRSSPDTSTDKNIKFVRPKGFKLVVRDVPGKPEWVVTRYNTYYWKAYTK